jgi:hypothetical protein
VARTVEQATVRTDYDERVCVNVDENGDLSLSLTRFIHSEAIWDRTDEVTLRPSQAERLAADLLAFANGDHRLPVDAVRPVRIVQPSETPDDSEFTRGYRQAVIDNA